MAEHIGKHAPRLIIEAEQSILEAIDVAREAADAEDKELVCTIPISVKWNFDKNKIEVSVAVAVRHKYTSEASLPDPNQPELLDGEGNPIPEGNIKQGLRTISRAMRHHGAEVEGGAK